MNHQHNHANHLMHGYTITDFLPLIIIFSIIIGLTVLKGVLSGWKLKYAMSDFMGFFFLIFGIFKIINLQGFVSAFKIYDVVTQQSIIYGYLYPFIEVALGLAYLFRFKLFYTNIIAIIIMSVSSIGVAIELSKGKEIMCACLGAVFKLPMTYVTLLEDLLMLVMALIMLFM